MRGKEVEGDNDHKDRGRHAQEIREKMFAKLIRNRKGSTTGSQNLWVDRP